MLIKQRIEKWNRNSGGSSCLSVWDL